MALLPGDEDEILQVSDMLEQRPDHRLGRMRRQF